MESTATKKHFEPRLAQRLESEKIAFGFLVAWCLLPIVIACVSLGWGIIEGYTNYEVVNQQGFLRLDVLLTYRRLFLVLGLFTLLYALTQIVFCWKKIASRKSVKEQPWLYLLLGLLAWAIISTLLSDDIALQFRGSEYRCDGLFSYFIYLGVFCCGLRLESKMLKTTIMRIFIVVVNVLCIIMLCQAMRVWPIYHTFLNPYAAVFNQFNHFGYIMCMASLCSAGLFLYSKSAKTRAAYIVSFTLQVFTLIINDTFGCYLAVIVGLIAIILFWKFSGRKLSAKLLAPVGIFAVLSIMSFLGVFSFIRPNGVFQNFFQLANDMAAISEGSEQAQNAGTGRMKLWIEALAMIPDRPLFGYGPEGLLGDYMTKVGIDRPHNEFIQYAVFLGIPALLMYVAALVTLVIRQWKNLKRLDTITIVAAGIVVGYVTSSLFGNTMFNTVPYYWMFLSLACCLPERSEHVLGDPDSGPAVARFAKLSPFMRVFACIAGAFLFIELLLMALSI